MCCSFMCVCVCVCVCALYCSCCIIRYHHPVSTTRDNIHVHVFTFHLVPMSQDNVDTQSQKHEIRTFPDEGRDDVISCMGLTNDFLIFATAVCYEGKGEGGRGRRRENG